MGILDFILLGVSLSMDAFAMRLCKGLCMHGGIKYRDALVISGFFGFFQFLMPVIGWALGVRFGNTSPASTTGSPSPCLGIWEARCCGTPSSEKVEDASSCPTDPKLDMKELLLMAIATSIDALAVGITLAFLSVNIWQASSIIGVTTFIISFAGVAIGNRFGTKFQKGAKVLGGCMLILIGTKILLEHLGILSF
jgi:putative Mn2+ efflux pump MntP